jgi:hypothetical protein
VAKAITGMMHDGSQADAADYKGSVIIEWSSGKDIAANQVMPGVLQAVRDTVTGNLIPAASITIHIPCPGLVTADVAVYLDGHGEILYDLAEVAKSGAVPATFPFLVAGMRAQPVGTSYAG